MIEHKTIIEPASRINILKVRELIQYKDLLYFLTLKGIKAKYAQSILGVGWSIIQPLSQTLIFTLIFGNLAEMESDGVPYFLFSMVAMVSWNYFSNILTESSNSLIANKAMLSKVYFPRIVLPLSSVFSKMVDFMISFIVMVGFCIAYGFYPSWETLSIVPLIIILILTSLGTGMLLSAMALQYRDVQYAMSFLVRILMYSAPIVYSVELIPERFLVFYSLNPMVGVIEGMRSVILGTRFFPWQMVISATIVSLLVFVIGIYYFYKVERKFADIA